MKTSPYLDEIRAESQLETLRGLLLHLGKKKFGKLPTRRQQQELGAIVEPGRLEILAERLLDVDSWGELLSDA
jgi:hypothetical protein